MSPHLQAKLLHVLQDGQFSRLGARAVVNVDVRVLAATNMDVKEAHETGRFPEDLYYGLNVFSLHIRRYAERITEIPLLFRHFLVKYSEKYQKQAPILPRACWRRLRDTLGRETCASWKIS